MALPGQMEKQYEVVCAECETIDAYAAGKARLAQLYFLRGGWRCIRGIGWICRRCADDFVSNGEHVIDQPILAPLNGQENVFRLRRAPDGSLYTLWNGEVWTIVVRDGKFIVHDLSCKSQDISK